MNQQEASAQALAMKQQEAADPTADRERNAHLEPEPYPRDERGFTDTAGGSAGRLKHFAGRCRRLRPADERPSTS